MKYSIAILSLFVVITNCSASTIPDFLDKKDIEGAEFKCLGDEVHYTPNDQKYVDILWSESLKYLEAYAEALTHSIAGNCINSDVATVDTTNGNGTKMCIMDRRDMKLLVKNIYQIINNKESAKKCFGARENVDWLYTPDGELLNNSPVAQWENRMTFSTFFNQKVKDKAVRKYGKEFTKNFYKMVTGSEIKVPSNFPYDISANALPNLWAAAGWYPMYAEESPRNAKNFKNVRGGYAYAEILGHWGLLRIDEINGEKVGAEIGMTVQSVDTLYPFHNHAISETYYNLRLPACVDEFKSLAVRADSPLVTTVADDHNVRTVQFDSGRANSEHMWISNASNRDPLMYFHQNTIHAFEVDGKCEAAPEERALVSVWARSNANDTRNDYGTTKLCESANKPGTPAHKGEVIQCQLTKTKW